LLSSSLIDSGAVSASTFVGIKTTGFLFEQGLTFLLGSLIVPVIGWIVGVIGLVFSFTDYLGIWIRKNTREDITKSLLKWLNVNKAKILEDSLKKFKDLMDNFIKMLVVFKEFINCTDELINECKKFIENSRDFPPTDYKEEMKSLLINPRLLSFFTRVFKYQDPPQEQE